MRVGQAGDAGHGFVHPCVVFHGAGAQRIHSQVDGVVPGGEPGEVADDLKLAHLGHLAQVFAFAGSEQLSSIGRRDIERREFVALLARRGFFEDQTFVLAGVLADLLNLAFCLFGAH